MKNTRKRFLTHFRLSLGFICMFGSVWGAAPPSHQLLPKDTLAMISVPNYAATKAAYSASPWIRFWQDPSMTPFREKFISKFREQVLAPMEKESGVKWADYADLLQGQITLAVVENGWTGTNQKLPAWLVIVDTEEKQDLLQQRIDELKTMLNDSGQALRTETIRDKPFYTLPKGSDGGSASASMSPLIGKSGSLLLASNSSELLTSVIAKQESGASGALYDLDAFKDDFQLWLRESEVYGWVNFSPILQAIESMSLNWQKATGPNPMMPPADKLFQSFGLRAIKSFSFATRETEKGSVLEMNIGAPASERKGLIKVIAGETRDSGPAPFVGADAVTFGRSRLNGQQFWAAVESTLAEVSPQLNGILQMSLSALGKDKDPNFDFKQSFIRNLGNDWITWQGASEENTLDALVAPPTIYLVGSPNPKQFVEALKVAVGFVMPPETFKIKEREFLGRMVFELPLPPSPNPLTGEMVESSLSFSAGQGYVAFSTHAPMLEAYLRNEVPGGTPLIQKTGLRSAIDEVGGTESGLFGYQNDKAVARSLFNLVKTNPDLLDTMFSMVPVGDGKTGADAVKEWVDPALLPDFNQVSKYFGFSVYSGGANERGMRLKFFNPIPEDFK